MSNITSNEGVVTNIRESAGYDNNAFDFAYLLR